MPANDPLQNAIDQLKADLYMVCHHGDALLGGAPSTKKALLKRFQGYADLFHEAATQAIRHGERCSFYESVYFCFADGRVDFHCLPVDFLKEALRPQGEFTGETWSAHHAKSAE